MFLITYVLDGENNVCIAFIWSKKLKLYLKNKVWRLSWGGPKALGHCCRSHYPDRSRRHCLSHQRIQVRCDETRLCMRLHAGVGQERD